MTRPVLFMLVADIAFIAITFFEQLPVLGWLGGVVSIAAWIALTRLMLVDPAAGLPSAGAGLAWAGILGASSGFVGALTAWMAQTGNLFGFTTPPGDRFGAAFGFIGASLGILYWPVVGAIVCAVTALVVTSRGR